jgi:hypothetical protein
MIKREMKNKSACIYIVKNNIFCLLFNFFLENQLKNLDFKSITIRN